MEAILSLFGWCPGPLKALFVGGVCLFLIYGVFKIVMAVIRAITDIIPGW